MTNITESSIEQYAIDSLISQYFYYMYSPEIAPDLSACDSQAGSETPARQNLQEIQPQKFVHCIINIKSNNKGPTNGRSNTI